MEMVARLITLNSEYWKGRRVLLTGHTGFKGAWIALLLELLGAQVTGVALPPDSTPNLYAMLSPWPNLDSIICDIRNRHEFDHIIKTTHPEIVIHMAAQALVLPSYYNPVDTIDINVMGTINLLESLRHTPDLKAILIITTDKVYENINSNIAMTENSPLGGHDPYSASKAAVEILTASYSKSFFAEKNIPVCTARAGNVIGGGDWAQDRIIPNLWHAYNSKQLVDLRHPDSVRPWQHVLDPLYGYLLYLQSMQINPHDVPRALNFGPPLGNARTVLDIAKHFSNTLESDVLYKIGKPNPCLTESKYLSIDATLANSSLGWRTMLDVDQSINWTCQWYKAYQMGQDMREFSIESINAYLELVRTTTTIKELEPV
jgi:CDP-glucose 4,6-dehydratase